MRKPSNIPNMINTAQAAEILGLAESTLRDWRQQPFGPPYYRITNRVVRYRQSEVESYRDTRRYDPPARAAKETYANR